MPNRRAAHAERMRKGKFDLEDLSDQLAQVEKIGGLGGIMGMLPGVAKMKDQLASANIDDRIIKRQRAIISSMTREERRNPDLLKASRKKRVAAGSGVKVEDVNKLLKQHRQMADMMKSMGGAKRGGAMGKMASMLGLPGGGAACRSQRRNSSPPCKSKWAQRHAASAPQSRPHAACRAKAGASRNRGSAEIAGPWRRPIAGPWRRPVERAQSFRKEEIMAEADNLILEHLPHMRGQLDRVEHRLGDVIVRQATSNGLLPTILCSLPRSIQNSIALMRESRVSKSGSTSSKA